STTRHERSDHSDARALEPFERSIHLNARAFEPSSRSSIRSFGALMALELHELFESLEPFGSKRQHTIRNNRTCPCFESDSINSERVRTRTVQFDKGP
ncbi:hypothetical protein BGZ70_004988, partial [Mortierella alpina]